MYRNKKHKTIFLQVQNTMKNILIWSNPLSFQIFKSPTFWQLSKNSLPLNIKRWMSSFRKCTQSNLFLRNLMNITCINWKNSFKTNLKVWMTSRNKLQKYLTKSIKKKTISKQSMNWSENKNGKKQENLWKVNIKLPQYSLDLRKTRIKSMKISTINQNQNNQRNKTKKSSNRLRKT